MDGYKKEKKTGALLLFAAIASKPLYLWSSGYPQISDILIVLFAIRIVSVSPVFKVSKVQVKWMIIFIITISYQIIINLVWERIAHNQGYKGTNFNYSLYYIFNFLVSTIVFIAYNTYGYEKLERLYLKATIVSSIICMIGIIMNYKVSGRQTGFFNNPNQLGYYSVILLTVVLVFKNSISKIWYITAILVSLLINALSLSKASIISAAFLLLVNSISSNYPLNLKRFVKLFVQVLIILFAVYLIMFSRLPVIQDNRVVQSVRHRIINMSRESDADMGTGRGYDRIEEVGINIITGVGEGFYKRFKIMYDHEIHSMYASLLVCYGVFGAAGYFYLLYVPLKGLNRELFNFKNLSLFSGILLYSFTHNSIRNTLLWFLLSMLMVRDWDNQLYADVNKTLNP